MNYLLKIVEGPNKGAEIALPDGVAVTLGKGDGCDIVLADPTLPEKPVSLEAGEGGVSADGEALEPFAVKTLGSTSFAVGPAGSPWGALKWPAEESKTRETGEGKQEEAGSSQVSSPVQPSEEKSGDDAAPPKGKRRIGWGCGCLVAVLVAFAALALLAWLFRDHPKAGRFKEKAVELYEGIAGKSGGDGETPPATLEDALAALAEKFGLSMDSRDGSFSLSGNMKTRRERLQATAEAYQTMPGIALDLSDDESFRASAEDAVFTLSEGSLKVVSATNRVLSLAGATQSPQSLGRILKALAADLPKMRDADVSGVRFDAALPVSAGDSANSGYSGYSGKPAKSGKPGRGTAAKAKAAPQFPVCGILVSPYPCLVMQNGMRILEGASIGENTILKIEADAVTVTNSTGRFTWKP